MAAMDKWLFAENTDGSRFYIIHTADPYLVFDVYEEEQPEEKPEWAFESEFHTLVPIFFVGERPSNEKLEMLAVAAIKQLQLYDQELAEVLQSEEN